MNKKVRRAEPAHSDIDRLAAQIQRLEQRSGRRAASVCITAPDEVDAELLVEGLRRSLDTEETEFTVERRSGVPRVVTVDFQLPRAESA